MLHDLHGTMMADTNVAFNPPTQMQGFLPSPIRQDTTDTLVPIRIQLQIKISKQKCLPQ